MKLRWKRKKNELVRYNTSYENAAEALPIVIVAGIIIFGIIGFLMWLFK